MRHVIMTTFMILIYAHAMPAGFKIDKNSLVIKELVITNVRCHGQANGMLTVIAEGGKLPYYYSLNGTTFQKDPHFNGLKGGEYKLYVKDAAGSVKINSFTVHQPQKLHFLPAKYTEASCCYSDGAALVNAVGGSGPVKYQINEGPFQNNGYFTGLSGGYTVTVKDSVGCTASQVIAISDFNGPVIDFINSTDVSCYGGNNGTVSVVAMGGSGELQYSMNGGKTYQKETVFKQLRAGKYTIRVKDESGCLDSNTIVISQPPAMEIVATSTCLPGSTQKNDIQVEYSIGGRGLHLYSINNTDFQESKVFRSVDPGTYTVYVKDAGGCLSSTKITCTPSYSIKRERQ